MKTITTKVVSMAAAIVLVFGSASLLPQGFSGNSTSITASAASVRTGKIGENVRWKLEDGTLTISGTGETYNYEYYIWNEERNITPFNQLDAIKNVVIEPGITKIGERLFDGCPMETISIPDTVKTIGEYAFWGTRNLKSVKIPKSVTTIEEAAFGISGITSVSLPDTLTSIGEYAFAGAKLKSVTIPGSVKMIRFSAFNECDELESVVIGSGISKICEIAFANCGKLKSVKIPDTVGLIGKQAFTYCGLKTINIPNSVKQINDYAFSYTDIESVNVPDSVTNMGKGVFGGCQNLKTAALPDNLDTIEGTFYDCRSLESVKLPSKLKTIGKETFYQCYNLDQLRIPDTVTSIGKQAIGYCQGGKISRVKILCDKYNEAAVSYARSNGIRYTVLDRLAGKNRYETAVKISQASFKSTGYVVLASGKDYADALAGVPLAWAYSCPILLTDNKTLPAETLTEIKRLGAKNVMILGGTGAVSEDVENALRSNDLTTKRIAGKTRFETAVEISKDLGKKQRKANSEIFFVYGHGFADALSIGSIAANNCDSIIYLNKNGEIDKATKEYLASIKGTVKKAYVIGGEGVISNEMMNKAANACGLTKATRIAGKNRYETCTKVNETFANDLAGESVFIAKGTDFPDALAGGVYAAIKKSPVLLADGSLTDVHKKYLEKQKITDIYALGGKAAVPDSIVTGAATISK